jgi:hypothetical protein
MLFNQVQHPVVGIVRPSRRKSADLTADVADSGTDQLPEVIFPSPCTQGEGKKRTCRMCHAPRGPLQSPQ